MIKMYLKHISKEYSVTISQVWSRRDFLEVINNIMIIIIIIIVVVIVIIIINILGGSPLQK